LILPYIIYIIKNQDNKLYNYDYIRGMSNLLNMDKYIYALLC
jgi:hypothetical protein